jgi:hypothetical protein
MSQFIAQSPRGERRGPEWPAALRRPATVGFRAGPATVGFLPLSAGRPITVTGPAGGKAD